MPEINLTLNDNQYSELIQLIYWAILEEDYDWRDTLPNTDCLCEICFDIFNREKKIKWVNEKNPFECK